MNAQIFCQLMAAMNQCPWAILRIQKAYTGIFAVVTKYQNEIRCPYNSMIGALKI